MIETEMQQVYSFFCLLKLDMVLMKSSQYLLAGGTVLSKIH